MLHRRRFRTLAMSATSVAAVVLSLAFTILQQRGRNVFAGSQALMTANAKVGPAVERKAELTQRARRQQPCSATLPKPLLLLLLLLHWCLLQSPTTRMVA